MELYIKLCCSLLGVFADSSIWYEVWFETAVLKHNSLNVLSSVGLFYLPETFVHLWKSYLKVPSLGHTLTF